MYRGKKEEVHRMIREEMEKYEENLTEEIWKNRGKGSVFKNIKKIKGELDRGQEIKIYEEGKIKEIEEALSSFFEFWRLVYNMGENKIEEAWDEEVLMNLMQEFEEEEQVIEKEGGMEEHEDMVRRIEHRIKPMRIDEMGEEEFRDRLRNLRSNKAAGPNKLKAELFKELGKRQGCRGVMLRCFNNVIGDNNVPEDWKTSRTTMIKKVGKPSVKDFRPIAILNVSYKIFMAYIRDRIEDHLRRNNLIRDNQTGFTGGGRIEYNHMMLQYIVDKAVEDRGKGMVVMVALDFKKAFDSVDRKRMVETMIKYRVDPKVIDIIAKVYTGDKTIVRMGERVEEIKVAAGIRQGCTASTVFFKLVTYEIMRELEERGIKFTIEDLVISSIFFADDGVLMAKGLEEAKRNLEIVKEVSKRFGLVVNEEKSKVLIFKKGARKGMR